MREVQGISSSAPWGGVLTCYSTLGLYPMLKAEEKVGPDY